MHVTNTNGCFESHGTLSFNEGRDDRTGYEVLLVSCLAVRNSCGKLAYEIQRPSTRPTANWHGHILLSATRFGRRRDFGGWLDGDTRGLRL